MVALTDIAPQSQECHGVTVTGISSKGMAYLFGAFPELAKLSIGQGIKPAEIFKMAPKAIPAIIAAGCGSIANEAAEEIAGSLPIETQLDLLEMIGRLTFPSGLGPFVERILALSKHVSGEVSKVQDMSLQPPLKNSQAKVSQSEKSGS